MFGIRTAFTADQLRILNEFYTQVSNYPTKTQKEELSFQLGVTVKRIAKWFDHKRNSKSRQ